MTISKLVEKTKVAEFSNITDLNIWLDENSARFTINKVYRSADIYFVVFTYKEKPIPKGKSEELDLLD